MEALMMALVRVFHGIVAWCDIKLAAHDGIDFVIWRQRGELVAAAHVAMIRDGQGWHSEIFAFG